MLGSAIQSVLKSCLYTPSEVQHKPIDGSPWSLPLCPYQQSAYTYNDAMTQNRLVAVR